MNKFTKIALGVIALALVVGVASVASAASYTFTRDLTVGSTGADVLALQQLLNADPMTQVSSTGAGSAGQETTYFGTKTKAAVAKFQAKYGISPAAGYFGPKTRGYVNSLSVNPNPNPNPTPVGSDLSVTLALDNPAASAFAGGATPQALADLAHFTFKNNSSTEAKITSVKLSRLGLSSDSTLANVYLYNGVNRLTDSASVSAGVITFNDLAGLFTVAPGASITVSVRSDIAANTAGQMIGVALTSVSSNVPVSGALPIAGNLHSIANASTAGANFSTSITPSTASIDPQDDYVMWKDNVSITTRAVWLKAISFRQIGSVAVNELQNFRLYVDGVMVGPAVAGLDAKGYVTFDLSAAPVKLATGNREIKLVGNVVGGSNKTFSFSLQRASDVNLVDSEIGQAVLAQYNSTTFSAITTGTQTINTGTLTITKKTDSPSGNVTPDASNVVLASFEVKAAGEAIKVENLLVNAAVSTAGVGSLRNGALFANGVQIGSTQSLTDSGTGNATFNLGSSLVVYPGSPVTLEVRADIYDNDGTPATIASGDTVQANIVAGTSNAQRLNSLTYFSTSAVSGNTLTVAVGSLTGSKYNAYGNQTVVVPQTAYKIGDFRVTANSNENVNINTLTLNVGGDATTTSTAVTDVFVKYYNTSSPSSVKTTATKATVNGSTQTWNVNDTLSAGGTMAFEVYATLSSSIANSSTTLPVLTVSGSTQGSATSATTGAIAGQTTTVATGSISAAAVSDSTLATMLVKGNTTGNKLASFRLTASNQDYKVTDLAIKVSNANAAGAITKVTLKNGSTVLGEITSFDANLTATSTGLSLKVPANDSNGAVVDAYVDTNNVAAGAATTTANVKVTLEGFKYIPWNGGTQAEYATDQAANNQYVVKSIPKVETLAVSGNLTAGTNKTIGKIKVTADGAIGWKKIAITISKTAGVTLGATSTLALYDGGNNLIAGAFATTSDILGGDTSGVVTFVADSEQQITTSETYDLRTTVAGIASGYNYVSVSVAAPSSAIATPYDYATIAATTASFVWSDRSSNSHSETTPDWLNDYKVKTLPTDSSTLSVTI